MQLIERLLSICARIMIWAAGFSLAAMMLHVFSDVALKYLLNQPIPGTAEVVARYYMVAAVFLPLPFVEIRNSGISVDLFYMMFGRSLRRVIVALAYLGQTIFFSLLAYQSFWDALKSYAKSEYVDGQIIVVVWPASFFLPLGFGLATLVSVLRIAQTLIRTDWQNIVEYNASAEADRPIEEVA